MITTPEYRLMCLRDALPPGERHLCENPAAAVGYWQRAVVASPAYNPDVENLAVLLLNARRRITGHHYVATGILDQLMVGVREVFRVPLVANAAAFILGHNHPSGDPAPSEADIKVTLDLIRAGQLLNVPLLDHIIIGAPEVAGSDAGGWVSLRELGYFDGVSL